MTPEAKLQQKIISFLRDYGLMVRPVEWRGRKDCPDLVILNPPTVWVEVKTPTGKLRSSQRREHDLMREAGAKVMVARSIEDCDAIVQRYYPGARPDH